MSHLVRSLGFVPGAGQAPAYGLPLLGVGWTLNYEMYFYFVFGLALLFGKWRWAAMAVWFTMTLVVPGIYFSGKTAWINLFPYQTCPLAYPVLQMVSNPIIWFFIFGMFCGHIHNAKWLQNIRNCRFLIQLALLAVFVQYFFCFRTLHGITCWGLTLIPFFASLCIVRPDSGFWSSRYLVFLGNISYSLYLVHPTVQRGYSNLAGNGPGYHYLVQGWIPVLITTVLSIGAAFLSYRLIEIRLGRRLKSVVHSHLNQAGTA